MSICSYTLFLIIFNRHKFLAEFLEVGGVLTILEILGIKAGKEVLSFSHAVLKLRMVPCLLSL